MNFTYLQTYKGRWPTTANNSREIKILLAYNACWILQIPPGDVQQHQYYLETTNFIK
jgi:hypothetical protein